MSEIQVLSNSPSHAPANGQVHTVGAPGGSAAAAAERAAGGGNALGTLTNAQGQSLFDIREQLHAAVRDALRDAPAGADRAAVARAALEAALTEHGFDPAVLETAANAAFVPLNQTGAATLGAAPLGAATLGAGAQAAALLGGDGPSSLDDALFGDGDDEDGDGEGTGDTESFLQLLLAQFRPGIHLDLEL